MIPFPIYLTAIQDNLEAGFNDFRRETALYAGMGADSSLWTSDQIAELARDVDEAYRWVLYPEPMPGERVPHVWTFLESTTTLTTTSGTYNYTLPEDFGSFIDVQLYWPLNSGFAPVYRVSDTEILRKRQWTDQTGKPLQFGLRWMNQTAGSQQRQELIMWPTPDGAYVFTYKYAVLIGKLSESNPYPLGGPRIAQLLIEACKAIGETKKNGGRGDQWKLFISRLRSAIMLDKGTNTSRTVGVMRGVYDDEYMPQYQRSANYYFGPDIGGLYTLES